MSEDKYTTWMPSYGAEVRGGTAYSMTIISDEPVASPIVTAPDAAIVMNEPSFRKFRGRVKQGGILFVNSFIVREAPAVKDVKMIKLPFTDIALGLGNIKVANMVAAGAYIKGTKVVSVRTALRVLQEFIKDNKLLVLNKLAILKGASLVK
jgi:2-oxoglutarate ferredoxin oxidoreductase subunit gamma